MALLQPQTLSTDHGQQDTFLPSKAPALPERQTHRPLQCYGRKTGVEVCLGSRWGAQHGEPRSARELQGSFPGQLTVELQPRDADALQPSPGSVDSGARVNAQPELHVTPAMSLQGCHLASLYLGFLADNMGMVMAWSS